MTVNTHSAHGHTDTKLVSKIKELLGCGLKNEVVAQAVGCDPSYISRLMADEVFVDEVMILRAKNMMAETDRDKQIDGIEDNLLAKLREVVDNGMLYKPKDILQAAVAVNRMQRRGFKNVDPATTRQAIVNINLPKVIINNFKTNPQGEVIEIDGQTMVTMPTGTLLRELSKGDPNGKYEQVQRYLPVFEHGVSKE